MKSKEKDRLKCVRKLQSLLKRGFAIIGKYGRNSAYVYLKKDNIVKPFCLNDSTFNKDKEMIK